MKREIKFRGLKVDGKGWVYGYYFFDNKVLQAYIIDEETNVDVFSESVGQFTGKLCQEKQIYEGDIFEFDINEWGGSDNIHVVEWDDENSAWCWGGGGNGDMGWRKIIGNIHENPELL